MPKASIIVPVYNVEEYLEECIRSLFDQTETDFEIIAVNDGSTDKSGIILDKLAKEDSRLRVIHKENEGVSASRNLGLDLAVGEWITFVDSDDWCESEMLETALRYANENEKYEIVIFSLNTRYKKVVEGVSNSLLPYAEGNVSDHREDIELCAMSRFYSDNNIKSGFLSIGGACAKLVKRSLIEKLDRRFNKLLIRAQDTVFWMELFEHAQEICYIDKPLYNYRRWSGSVSYGDRFIPDSNVAFDELIREYESFADRYHKDERFQYAIELRAFSVIQWSLKHNYANKKNLKSLRIRKREFAKFISREPYCSAIRNVPTTLAPRMLWLLRRKWYYSCIILYTLFIAKSD